MISRPHECFQQFPTFKFQHTLAIKFHKGWKETLTIVWDNMLATLLLWNHRLKISPKISPTGSKVNKVCAFRSIEITKHYNSFTDAHQQTLTLAKTLQSMSEIEAGDDALSQAFQTLSTSLVNVEQERATMVWHPKHRTCGFWISLNL